MTLSARKGKATRRSGRGTGGFTGTGETTPESQPGAELKDRSPAHKEKLHLGRAPASPRPLVPSPSGTLGTYPTVLPPFPLEPPVPPSSPALQPRHSLGAVIVEQASAYWGQLCDPCWLQSFSLDATHLWHFSALPG